MMEGAARRRRAREMERRLAELDRWAELYGLGAIPSSPPPRRRRRRSGAGWLLVLGVGAAAALFPTQSLAVLDRVTALVPGGGDQPAAWAGEVGSVVQDASAVSGPLGGLTEGPPACCRRSTCR